MHFELNHYTMEIIPGILRFSHNYQSELYLPLSVMHRFAFICLSVRDTDSDSVTQLTDVA